MYILIRRFQDISFAQEKIVALSNWNKDLSNVYQVSISSCLQRRRRRRRGSVADDHGGRLHLRALLDERARHAAVLFGVGPDSNLGHFRQISLRPSHAVHQVRRRRDAATRTDAGHCKSEKLKTKTFCFQIHNSQVL